MGRGQGAEFDQRTTHLADAAVRVIEREGLGSLSFRTVAAEAGVSTGRVQHYFRNSKGLAASTFRRVQARVAADVRQTLSEEGASKPSEVVRATLHGLVPDSGPRRELLRVAYIVEQYAMTDEQLSIELREGRDGLIDFLAQQISKAAEVSAVALPDGEATRAQATTLLALADGLSSLSLSETIDSVEAKRLLNAEVERVIGA